MNEMKFRRTDLRFVVDYDYERSSCTCNGDICRCTRIYRAFRKKLLKPIAKENNCFAA